MLQRPDFHHGLLATDPSRILCHSGEVDRDLSALQHPTVGKAHLGGALIGSDLDGFTIISASGVSPQNAISTCKPFKPRIPLKCSRNCSLPLKYSGLRSPEKLLIRRASGVYCLSIPSISFLRIGRCAPGKGAPAGYPERLFLYALALGSPLDYSLAEPGW